MTPARLWWMAAATLACSVEDGVVEDGRFDLWCGDELCSWRTEEGAIRRAPTWHQKDYGVELEATPTALSQTLPVSSACLKFRVVGHFSNEADVALELDLFSDGVAEHTEPLPPLSWSALELLAGIDAPGGATPLRVVLRKRGSGKAVVGELSAEELTSCPNASIQVGGTPP